MKLKIKGFSPLEFIFNQFKNKYHSKMLWHYTFI